MNFTKENTLAVKGMAILFMLCRHLLIVNRQPCEKQLNTMFAGSMDLYLMLGLATQICVAMFMFLGGVGFYYSMEKENSLFQNIANLYKRMWKIFIIYIPVGFLLYYGKERIWCQDATTCVVFQEFRMSQFLLNFFGFRSEYNREWWFFKTYICCLLIGFVFVRFTKTLKYVSVHIGIVIAFHGLTQYIFPYIAKMDQFAGVNENFFFINFCTIQQSASCFILGIVFTKFHLLDRLIAFWNKSIKKRTVSMMIGAFGICLVLFIRFRVFEETGDLLLIIFIVLFSLKFAQGADFLEKCFMTLGKYSSSMWLIHTFYCFYYYHTAMIVYWSRRPVVAYLTLVIMTFISAFVVDGLYDFIKMKWKEFQKTKSRVSAVN